VQYHLWHTLGMIAVGLCAAIVPDGPWLRAAGALLLAGVLLFSGSLYALALGAARVVGAITPFGGVSWAVGWICLVIASVSGGRR